MYSLTDTCMLQKYCIVWPTYWSVSSLTNICCPQMNNIGSTMPGFRVWKLNPTSVIFIEATQRHHFLPGHNSKYIQWLNNQSQLDNVLKSNVSECLEKGLFNKEIKYKRKTNENIKKIKIPFIFLNTYCYSRNQILATQKFGLLC